MRVACIGSRELTEEQITVCEKLGKWVVQCGHELHTGNAQGADQAFARGGNQIDPAYVHLHLPWAKYEREAVVEGNIIHLLDDLDSNWLEFYTLLAKKHHPAWERLSQGAQKLMIRNSSILCPTFEDKPVDACLALPSDKRGGGGTGQGMRIAEDQGVVLMNIRDATPKELYQLCEDIRPENSSSAGTA